MTRRLAAAHTGGFGLIELLVVMSIISVLMAILLPALGRTTETARQLNAMSGLRQMELGYVSYQMDFDGHVLFGYTPATVLGREIDITTESGHTFGLPVADRYPWRLAPYVGNLWEIIHSHTDVPEYPVAGDSDKDAGNKAYTLSLTPTFGLNSIYLGGHGTGGFRGFVTDAEGVIRPNVNEHVVFREAEVRRPSEMIVFTDSKARGGQFSASFEENTGLYFATPPHAAGHRWQASNGPDATANGFEILMRAHLTGLPEGRYSQSTITGFFDGHVTLKTAAELEDMRLWANEAQAADYDFVN